MNSKIKGTNIRSELDAIFKKLGALEGHMIWLIRSDARFRVGQRVEWSRRGREQGFPRRKIAQKGTVKAISGFSIVVKLDGLKQQRSFHHAFFNPVSGGKLF